MHASMGPEPVLSVRIRASRPARRGGSAPDAPFALDMAFDAPPGVTVLFGPSGCGKSTTLAAIAGLVRPDAGRIALGGEVWFDAEAGVDRAPQRRGVAFVFQSLALFPHMTAAANVEYGMRRDHAAPERRRRALELLSRLKVPHLASRRPATFSGGEAQRVALARAFAMSPRIALFDEPFSAMDRPLRRALVADVATFVRELAIPLVHVTHRASEARDLADRVVLMEAGRVVDAGRTADLLPRQAPEDDGEAPRRSLTGGRKEPPPR